VTGVLPIAINEATKVLQVLLHGGKEYVCVMQLHGSVPDEALKGVLAEFQGEVFQRPPLRASVKRVLRTRFIYYLNHLETKERYVLFKVGCEAGTYVRKLCFDIGQVLGCGAHMKELRRTRVGPFVEDVNLVSFEGLADAWDRWCEGMEEPLKSVIQPVEKALILQPEVTVRDSAVDALCHGADLALPGIVSLSDDVRPGSTVAIYTLKKEAVALGKALMSTPDILEKDKGLAVKTERVVLKPGTYPRKWRT